MVLKADQVRVKALLAETITLLCKNGLHFKAKFSIQALIGITLDEEDVFLVNINETIQSKDSAPADANEDSGPFEQQHLAGKRLRSAAARTTSGPSPGPASPGVKSLGGNSTIPKIPSNSHSRSTRITRQASPHSVSAARSSDVGTRPTDSVAAGAVFTDSLAEATTDSLPSANLGVSESGDNATFPVVSIKNDSQSNDDESYDDSKPLPEESDLPEEPSSKRMRLRVSDVRPERSLPTPTSSEANANFASLGSAAKSEPPDVIEIKEESYSDSESQLPNYSAYGDYSSAMYGSANADMTHAFGEASMFQAGSSSFFVPQSGDGGEQTPELMEAGGRGQIIQRRAKSSTQVPGCYECQTCGNRFSWMSALLRHENNLHGRKPHPFRCQVCSKGFWNRRDLRGHLASKHQMKKDFPCLICEKEYSYKHHLKDHMISIHRKMLI